MDDLDMPDCLCRAARLAQKEGMDVDTFLRCARVYWDSTKMVFEAMSGNSMEAKSGDSLGSSIPYAPDVPDFS